MLSLLQNDQVQILSFRPILVISTGGRNLIVLKTEISRYRSK
jgi:hypothetical protein